MGFRRPAADPGKSFTEPFHADGQNRSASSRTSVAPIGNRTHRRRRAERVLHFLELFVFSAKGFREFVTDILFILTGLPQS